MVYFRHSLEDTHTRAHTHLDITTETRTIAWGENDELGDQCPGYEGESGEVRRVGGSRGEEGGRAGRGGVSTRSPSG